ncbi:hypothetical protein [Alkalihalobacillus sp. TS-13]|uniref:hypothetical protein n=1 Tax=Alkalihalobacillus sp. TS-13 TaxID=2842455 RepID=UPI001C87F82D|nr:hypothetical protein [Alkalihalobacillus sp. TS-13]
MSKSNAWKKRRKMEREGRRNPEWNRSDFALMDLRSRKTKTKKEKLNQQKHKGRLSDRNYDHDNGLFVYLRVVRSSLPFREHKKSGSDPFSHTGHWRPNEEARTKRRLGSAWANS